jgi:hypothetical protein
MAPAPEGPTVAGADSLRPGADTTEPALRIDLAPHMTGTRLVVRYGDRRLERDLAY